MMIIGLISVTVGLVLAGLAHVLRILFCALGDHTESLPGFAPVDEPSPSRYSCQASRLRLSAQDTERALAR